MNQIITHNKAGFLFLLSLVYTTLESGKNVIVECEYSDIFVTEVNFARKDGIPELLVIKFSTICPTFSVPILFKSRDGLAPEAAHFKEMLEDILSFCGMQNLMPTYRSK